MFKQRSTVLIRRVESPGPHNIAGVSHRATQIAYTGKGLVQHLKVLVTMDQNQVVKTVYKITDSLLKRLLVLPCHEDVPDARNHQRSETLLPRLFEQGKQLKTEFLASEGKQFRHEHIWLEPRKGLQKHGPAKRLGFLNA